MRAHRILLAAASASLVACSLPRSAHGRTPVRPAAAHPAAARARPAAGAASPRVELLAPCDAAARAGDACTHRYPVLEVSC